MKCKMTEAFPEVFYNDRPLLLYLFGSCFQTIYNYESVACFNSCLQPQYCVKLHEFFFVLFFFPVAGLLTAVVVFHLCCAYITQSAILARTRLSRPLGAEKIFVFVAGLRLA